MANTNSLMILHPRHNIVLDNITVPNGYIVTYDYHCPPDIIYYSQPINWCLHDYAAYTILDPTIMQCKHCRDIKNA